MAMLPAFKGKSAENSVNWKKKALSDGTLRFRYAFADPI